MSSKFSSPFLNKSPLAAGGYTSGADGMVTVSYNDIHQKFQDDLAKNVAKHYEVDTNPCDDPLTTSYNKDGVYKTCPKKEDGNGSNNTSDGDNSYYANKLPGGGVKLKTIEIPTIKKIGKKE